MFKTLQGQSIVADFIGILDEYIASHYKSKEEPVAELQV
jgi:hypothetical protein